MTTTQPANLPEEPERETTLETSRIPATEIKAGDLLVLPVTLDRVRVTKLKTTPQHVRVFDTHGDCAAYLRSDEQVTVHREVETPESRERRERARDNRMILARAGYAADQLEAAQRKIAAGNITSFTVTDLLRAQAEVAIYTEVLEAAENVGCDQIEAAHRVADLYAKELLQFGFRGDSRSTSLVDNVMVDIANQAHARFVETFRTTAN